MYIYIYMYEKMLRPLPPAPSSSSWLPFGELGASMLTPWETMLAPWEHLGAPLEQQDGLEAVRHRIYRFWEDIQTLF